MKSVGQIRLHAASRLKFRCDARALELLCSHEAVSRLEVAFESLNTKDGRSFLRGYRLAVAAPLNELLRFIVDQAELMVLEQDDRLSNWLHFRSPARGESLLRWILGAVSFAAFFPVAVCRALARRVSATGLRSTD